MANINKIDAGYRMSVEVLLNLNHDRYKSYFTQFIVLHFGIFTVYNSDKLENLTHYFAAVGILLAIVWYRVLNVIIADIKRLWDLIEDYEDQAKLREEYIMPDKIVIKINESRDSQERKKRGVNIKKIEL